ncbi:hypothetical protein HRG84_07175 [Flavisolibacter sp. BT320]|nr:hypothetical protein [Flavisolibacter longurius]
MKPFFLQPFNKKKSKDLLPLLLVLLSSLLFALLWISFIAAAIKLLK